MLSIRTGPLVFKSILWFSTVLGTAVGEFVAADMSCKNQLTVRALRTEKPESLEYVIDGKVFRTTHRLGKGTGVAYLRKAADGQLVVAKDSSERLSWDKTELPIQREIIVDRFLRERGEDIPRILAYDVQRGLVVREYVEGFLKDDFDNPQLDFTRAQKDEILKQLDVERNRIKVCKGMRKNIYSQPPSARD